MSKQLLTTEFSKNNIALSKNDKEKEKGKGKEKNDVFAKYQNRECCTECISC